MEGDAFKESMESAGLGVYGVLLRPFLRLCSADIVWKLEEAAQQGWQPFLTMCKKWTVEHIVQTLREGAGVRPTLDLEVVDHLTRYTSEKPEQSKMLPDNFLEQLRKCTKVSCELAPRAHPAATPW